VGWGFDWDYLKILESFFGSFSEAFVFPKFSFKVRALDFSKKK
jgi:hypothetical protein